MAGVKGKTGQNQFTKARRERHFEETREKIQATKIIQRFEQCFFGEVSLDAQQVAAGKTLLNKVLPDLQAVQMNAEVEHNYVAQMPATPETTEEWQNQHIPTLQ